MRKRTLTAWRADFRSAGREPRHFCSAVNVRRDDQGSRPAARARACGKYGIASASPHISCRRCSRPGSTSGLCCVPPPKRASASRPTAIHCPLLAVRAHLGARPIRKLIFANSTVSPPVPVSVGKRAVRVLYPSRAAGRTLSPGAAQWKPACRARGPEAALCDGPPTPPPAMLSILGSIEYDIEKILNFTCANRALRGSPDPIASLDCGASSKQPTPAGSRSEGRGCGLPHGGGYVSLNPRILGRMLSARSPR